MLNEVEDLARQRGWIVISETATPGFVGRLVTEHLPLVLAEIDPRRPDARLTGISAPLGLGGLTWRADEPHRPLPALRTQLAAACELLANTGTGLLLTLDEVHHHQVAELRDLTSALQHLIRERREIAFAGAGLPSSVNALLNDNVMTFLRRADRHALGRVPLADVTTAISEPIEREGRIIGAEQARRAAQSTDGYPFLIQLVGYHIWRQHPSTKRVSADDVEAGVVAAQRRLGSLVHEPSLADVSSVARTFLLAMAHDDGPSRMSDIAERLNVDGNYASQYRLRLIASELIEPAGHGRVTFSMPYLRDYLRDHVAIDVQRELPRGNDNLG